MTTKGSKRITKDRLKKYAINTGIVGVPLGVLLFTLIFNLGAATVGEYSHNTLCGGDELCWLNLNDTCFKKDVFIYPMNGSELINARPTDSIKEFRLYRRWGKNYRLIKLNETCKSTACGGKRGATNNAYSYAFRKGKCYDLRIEIEKDTDSTINWQINPHGTWVSWKYLYKNKTIVSTCTRWINVTKHKKVPIYKNVTVEVPCPIINKSCYTPCKSLIITTKYCLEVTKQEFVKYKEINYTVKEKQKYKCNKSVVTKVRDGVKIDGKKYMNKDGVSVYKDKVYFYKIPVGDRNWKEYPMRNYELQKGVSYVKKVDLSAVSR